MSPLSSPQIPVVVLEGRFVPLTPTTAAPQLELPIELTGAEFNPLPPELPKNPPVPPIEPSRPTHLTVWLLVVGCTPFVLVWAYAIACRNIREMFQLGPVIGWLFVAAIGLAVIAIGYSVWRLTASYRALRAVDHLRRELVATNPNADKAVRDAIRQYLGELRKISGPIGQCSMKKADSISRLEARYSEAGEDRMSDIENLEEYVLCPIDRQVDQIILSQAVQTAVSTALANQTLDPLLVAWHALRLTDRISRAYGVRANYWGTLQLTRHALAMVVFAEVADMAGELAGKLFTQRLVGLLGGRAAEGFGNGFLMLRFGHAVKYQCRPIVVASHPTKSLAKTLSDGIQRAVGNNTIGSATVDT